MLINPNISNLQTNLTNHNHNDNYLNCIDGGTYHLNKTDYTKLTNRTFNKNAIYNTPNGDNGFTNVKLVFGMVTTQDLKKFCLEEITERIILDIFAHSKMKAEETIIKSKLDYLAGLF